MIKKIIRKKHFRQLRSQLKGSKKLHDNGDPFFVWNITSGLTEVNLNMQKSDFPKALVGSHSVKSEILLRQILLKNYNRICSGIMQSIGSGKPVKVPAPNSWINSLESNGISLNRLGCKFTLYKFSVLCFLKAIAKTILLLLQYKLPKLTNKPYVVFPGLTLKNLPVSRMKKSYNLISWYQRSEIKKSEVQEVWVQVQGKKIPHIRPDIFVYSQIFPSFRKWSNYFLFLYKACASIAVALAGMILGKWWYGLLLEESIFLHYVSVFNNQDLAREYLFNNSVWYYKSLWTYEAEKKGSDVSLYYYSTNMGKINCGYQRADTFGLKIMQWRNFIVWDKQQRDFLKQFCPDANYKVVGIIDYVDSPSVFKTNCLGIKIAIFDVTPARSIIYSSIGMAFAPYYSEKLSLQFFSDIGEIVEPNQMNLFWKQKRIVNSKFIDNGFIRKRDLIINRFFSIVDPNVSARSLIEKCDAVISMPFTSTAIIGKELNKPSIYYDSMGIIEENSSHGIPVLKNIDELKKWHNSLNI
ncbi:polysaccharide biosynthesis PFTS motif protein [Bacteroidota bacterium]